MNKRRRIVQEIEFHLRAHHQRGEDGRHEQQNVQPITLIGRPHHINFGGQVLRQWGGEWGIELGHENLVAKLRETRLSPRVRPTARDRTKRASTRAYSIDCNSLPGLKRTALPGGIETSAPVRGLRPIPVLRGRTLNTPKPRNSIRSPLVRERRMLSKTVSTANSALVLVMPGLVHHFVDNVELNHWRLPSSDLRITYQVIDAKGHIRDCQRQRVVP